MKRTVCILFIIINLSLVASSSTPDTTEIIRAKSINPVTGQLEKIPIDTILFDTRFYNPPFQNTISVTFLGNAGQPFINNHVFDQTDYIPFEFHRGVYKYFHHPYNTLHYNTRKPFTEIRYLSSGARADSEQVLKALHTQNINQHTNIGLNYDVIASKGIYVRQEAIANRFSLFGSHDKDNYSIYASINTNRIQNQENGGIISIDNFLEHPADDPLAYPVKLNNASSAARNYSFFARQSFALGKSLKDTTRSVINLLPAGAGVNHTFHYSRYSRIYRDQIPAGDTLNFYQYNYYRINAANDSAFMHTVDNSINFSFRDRQQKNQIMAGIKHQFQGFSYLYPATVELISNDIESDTVIGNIFKRSYNNISVNGNIALEIGRFSAFINGEYFLAGYRANDLDARIVLSQAFGERESVLSLGGSLKFLEPDFFIRTYSSSHFQWNNDYNKRFDARAFAALRSGNGLMQLRLNAGVINNFVFFNEFAQPELKADNLYMGSVVLHKAFRWGGFNHIHDLFVQYASDDEAIRIPLFGYKSSIYYENTFFKDELKIQLGVDFLYNTEYYSDTYMPATGFFYRQNNRLTGNFPYLNGFLNWKVKRTRFYLTYTNVLASIAGHNYFTTYGYPMNWGSLKFGLAWTFYD